MSLSPRHPVAAALHRRHPTSALIGYRHHCPHDGPLEICRNPLSLDFSHGSHGAHRPVQALAIPDTMEQVTHELLEEMLVTGAVGH